MKKLGIPMVIMEPVKGGSLANFSDDINAKFKAMDKDASIASWAFRWVGSHSNAKVILSGMSSEEQVEDNLKTFSNFKPLNEAEEKMISEIVSDLQGRVQNGCTGCRYCMPCPAGVNIPQNFALWNKYHIYGTYDHVKNAWEKDLKGRRKGEMLREVRQVWKRLSSASLHPQGSGACTEGSGQRGSGTGVSGLQ